MKYKIGLIINFTIIMLCKYFYFIQYVNFVPNIIYYLYCILTITIYIYIYIYIYCRYTNKHTHIYIYN